MGYDSNEEEFILRSFRKGQTPWKVVQKEFSETFNRKASIDALRSKYYDMNDPKSGEKRRARRQRRTSKSPQQAESSAEDQTNTSHSPHSPGTKTAIPSPGQAAPTRSIARAQSRHEPSPFSQYPFVLNPTQALQALNHKQVAMLYALGYRVVMLSPEEPIVISCNLITGGLSMGALLNHGTGLEAFFGKT